MNNECTFYKTKYGCLNGVVSSCFYKNGHLMECGLSEEVNIKTPYGKLIPQYTIEGVRKRDTKSIAFYPNGNLKRILLEHQMPVKAPLGELNAELITFYESGCIKRIFPLNGKITGYWTEENEYELARRIPLDLPIGRVEKKIISLHFYETGAVKSVTLWPKEYLTVSLFGIRIKCRFGIAFHPDGSIKSLETAYPLFVNTPIGKIAAFDINANGINGDVNSLTLYEDGRIESIITSTDGLIIKDKKSGTEKEVEPGTNHSVTGEEEETNTLRIRFDKDNCYIDGYETFPLSQYNFEICNMKILPKSTCSDCESCGGGCGTV